MSLEGQFVDTKSIRVLTGSGGFSELAKDCVAFANALFDGAVDQMRIGQNPGTHQGTEYYAQPELLRRLDFKGTATLRGIESHRLRELILRDLEIYRKASIGEIHQRIDPEIPRIKVRYLLAKLYEEDVIGRTGSKRGVRYLWAKSA